MAGLYLAQANCVDLSRGARPAERMPNENKKTGTGAPGSTTFYQRAIPGFRASSISTKLRRRPRIEEHGFPEMPGMLRMIPLPMLSVETQSCDFSRPNSPHLTRWRVAEQASSPDADAGQHDRDTQPGSRLQVRVRLRSRQGARQALSDTPTVGPWTTRIRECYQRISSSEP